MGRPNILFLVWDACRSDYACEYADFLQQLSSTGLSFENAISPATWSLPSHASLFTGQRPDQHEMYRVSDDMGAIDLPVELSRLGYTTYGVSGNGFASFKTGFGDAFDDFWYTGGEEPFPEGLGVYEFVHKYRRSNGGSPPRMLAEMAWDGVTHEYPIKSIANILATFSGKAARRFPALQRLPHEILSENNSYSYHPEKNTATIRRILDSEAEKDDPFFIFANYMDTHRPYLPAWYRDESREQDQKKAEVKRLNDEVAAPWKFIRAVENDGVDSRNIELLREFYVAEVQRIDDHLEMIISYLERLGIRDETLVVVTADHGENLGEVDSMGHQRFGHEASISDQLVRVPLVLSHPSFSGRTVEEHVSLTNLYDVFTSTDVLTQLNAETVENEFISGQPVTTQYPALGGKEMYEKYPDVSRETLRHRVESNSVAGYFREWRLVVESNGVEVAWKAGEQREAAEAPDSLRNQCNTELHALESRRSSEESLSQEERSQLEALGYL